MSGFGFCKVFKVYPCPFPPCLQLTLNIWKPLVFHL